MSSHFAAVDDLHVRLDHGARVVRGLKRVGKLATITHQVEDRHQPRPHAGEASPCVRRIGARSAGGAGRHVEGAPAAGCGPSPSRGSGCEAGAEQWTVPVDLDGPALIDEVDQGVRGRAERGAGCRDHRALPPRTRRSRIKRRRGSSGAVESTLQRRRKPCAFSP